MKITTRPATKSDVLKVMVNMSDATAQDLRKLGLSPDETLGFYALRVPEKDAVTVVNGSAPIAVFGWDKWAPDGCWYSWLLTTRMFFPGHPAPLLAAKRHMRVARARHPQVQLLSITTQDTEEVRRWMKLLGFERLWESPLTLWRYKVR